MTMSGYSNAIVDVMLGWLKGFANWVLRLFNLAGSTGGSPLLWLSNNWLKLLIFFLIVGMVMDRLVWLIRWRPYWVWFRKERVIVNDDKFFADEDLDDEADWEDDGALNANWKERDYVVASQVVNRPTKNSSHGSTKVTSRPQTARPMRRIESGHDAVRGAPGTSKRVEPRRVSQEMRPNSYVKRGTKRPAAQDLRRRDAESGRSRNQSRFDDANQRKYSQAARPNASRMRSSKVNRVKPRHPHAQDTFNEDLFGVDINEPNVSDFFEDEVFNVSNLPMSNDFDQGDN